MLATMNQIVNLLSGFQKQFPPTNNQLRTFTNPMTQAMIQAGQITIENVQRRAPGNKGEHAATGSQGKVALLMEAKEKGAILDAEAKAFLADVECKAPYAKPLAITATTAFKVSHEDVYDSDFELKANQTPIRMDKSDAWRSIAQDLELSAAKEAVKAMQNLQAIIQCKAQICLGQSTKDNHCQGKNGQHLGNHMENGIIMSNDEVTPGKVSQEIHGGEQLDSDVDSVIDDHDNTITYHQYQLNNEVESVPTDVSSVVPGGISVITILDYLRSQLAGHIKTNEE
ncbi:hypothetical protein Tco_0918143 [Tanacetum coccineum]